MIEEGEGAPGSAERRKGFTITTNVAATALLAFVVQFSYVVYSMGRQSEKLDTVVQDVRDIKATQYTTRDAARDIDSLHRVDENHEVRIRGLEIRVSSQGK
jgi:hypothetical protein